MSLLTLCPLIFCRGRKQGWPFSFWRKNLFLSFDFRRKIVLAIFCNGKKAWYSYTKFKKCRLFSRVSLKTCSRVMWIAINCLDPINLLLSFPLRWTTTLIGGLALTCTTPASRVRTAVITKKHPRPQGYRSRFVLMQKEEIVMVPCICYVSIENDVEYHESNGNTSHFKRLFSVKVARADCGQIFHHSWPSRLRITTTGICAVWEIQRSLCYFNRSHALLPVRVQSFDFIIAEPLIEGVWVGD